MIRMRLKSTKQDFSVERFLYFFLFEQTNHDLSRIETYFQICSIQRFLPLNVGRTTFFWIKFTSTRSAQ